MAGKKIKLLTALLLGLVTLGIYLPATHFQFTNYDDDVYVTGNPRVQELSLANVMWALKSGYASNWHPLTWVSHMLDCELYGGNAGGHHLTNVILHAINAALLFLVLVQYTGNQWRSGLVAALFAWHPMHVESVAWVAERKDVLSGCIWLLTMAAYGWYARATSKGDAKARTYWILALFFFALGLMSKPMVVTLPFVMLLLDFWPLNRTPIVIPLAASASPIVAEKRFSWANLLWEKAAFFGLAAWDCRQTFLAQANAHSVAAVSLLSWPQRLANVPVSYVRYLGKLAWPAKLAVLYPYHAYGWAIAAGAGVFLLLMTVLIVLQARQRPYLITGWFWFLGTLVPVIGLVQVGFQSMADRYTYLPSIGIFIMLAWAIPEVWIQVPRRRILFGGVTVVILLAAITGTSRQLQYWRNSITLYEHDLSVTGSDVLIDYNLGEALQKQEDVNGAIVYYRQAIAKVLNPLESGSELQARAHYNLGLIYRRRQEWSKAGDEFQACVDLDHNAAASEANLAVTLLARHQDEAAMNAFQAAEEKDPRNFSEAGMRLAIEQASAEVGRNDDAIALAQKVKAAALANNQMDAAEAADARIAKYREQKP